MKKLLNKNLALPCIILLLLMTWGGVEVYNWEQKHQQYLKDFHKAREYIKEHREELAEQGFDIDEMLKPGEPQKPDALSLLIYIGWDSTLCYLKWLTPLIIIIVSTWNFSRQLRTGYVKNILLRMSYKKYMFTSLLKAWGMSMIIPIFWIYMLFLCYLITGTFTIDLMATIPCDLFTSAIIYPPAILMLLYIVYLILYSIFCTNLGLIFMKKKRDFIVSTIFAYITFHIVNYYYTTIVWFMVESYIDVNKIKIDYNLICDFSLYSHEFLQSGGAHWIPFIIIILNILLSILGLLSVYSNKEKMVEECEN